MRRLIFLSFLLFSPACLAAKPVQVLPGATPLWLLQDKDTNMIALQLRFQGGVTEDPDGKAGLGMMLTDMMQRGAGPYDASALTQYMRDHAIDLSITMDRDQTEVSLTAPVQYKKEAQALLRDVLDQPRFDKNELARAKQEQLAVLRDQPSDPNWRAQRLVNNFAYENSRYARPGGGTMASVASFSPADMQARHKALFNHRSVGAVLVGNIDAGEAQAWLAPYFNRADAPATSSQDFRQLSPMRLEWHEYNVPQATLTYVLPGLARTDPDYPALSVLDALLADGFGSRLMKAFREESGLSYGVSSATVSPDHGPLWQFSLQVPAAKAAQAADTLSHTINEAGKTAFSDREVVNARESLGASLAMGLTSSPAIASQLSAAQRDGLGPDYLDSWQAKLNKVTAGDVERVAAKLGNGTNSLTIIVGPVRPGSEWDVVKTLPGWQN